MKYEYPTVSPPLTGEVANRIIEAVDTGGHVASPQALVVFKRLLQRNLGKDLTKKSSRRNAGKRKTV